MHLVVDGYNLLHKIPELGQAAEKGKGAAALAAALALYRKKKPHQITLVFDGGPHGEAGKGSISGVPVHWSGPEAADEVIARLAQERGPGITVISDDRELAMRCMGAGSEVIPSWEFAAKLMIAAQGGGLCSPEEDGAGWDFTTKKKGPCRRLRKAQRRKKRTLDSL